MTERQRGKMMRFSGVPSTGKVVSTEEAQRIIEDFEKAWPATKEYREHVARISASLGIDQQYLRRPMRTGGIYVSKNNPSKVVQISRYKGGTHVRRIDVVRNPLWSGTPVGSGIGRGRHNEFIVKKGAKAYRQTVTFFKMKFEPMQPALRKP